MFLGWKIYERTNKKQNDEIYEREFMTFFFIFKFFYISLFKNCFYYT